MRLRILIYSAVLILAGRVAGGADYYAYVACESDDTVSLVRFDGSSASAVSTTTVGFRPTETEGPHGITVDGAGEHWFVSLAHGNPFGRVYKYRTEDNEMVGWVECGMFPATLRLNDQTGLLYVANFNLHGDHVPSSVSIVDPDPMLEVKRVVTGVMPHGSRFSRDSRHHYSVGMMSSDLYEIDTITMKRTRRFRIVMRGSGHTAFPTWVQPHPDGKRIFVACNGAGEIQEIDLSSWKMTRRWQTRKGPYNLDITSDGKTLIVTYKGAEATGIWNIPSGREVAVIENTRSIPHGIALSKDERYCFVSVEGKADDPGAVDVIDLAERKLVASCDVGKQAGGIVFWKQVPAKPAARGR